MQIIPGIKNIRKETHADVSLPNIPPKEQEKTDIKIRTIPIRTKIKDKVLLTTS